MVTVPKGQLTHTVGKFLEREPGVALFLPQCVLKMYTRPLLVHALLPSIPKSKTPISHILVCKIVIVFKIQFYLTLDYRFLSVLLFCYIKHLLLKTKQQDPKTLRHPKHVCIHTSFSCSWMSCASALL